MGDLRYPVAIPALYCPLPSAVHPGVDGFAARSIDWLAEFDLCSDAGQRAEIGATRASEWCCRIAPYGRPEQLQIVSDWTHLGFLIDDRRFDGGSAARRPGEIIPMMMQLMLALDQPEAPVHGDPFAAAFRDLSVRIRNGTSATVARRWAGGNMEWFFAVACLVGHRVAGTMPSVDEYMNLGPRDRAMNLTGSLIEIAEGTTLPDSERESLRVRTVTQVANMLVTIGNDLFSFNREAEHEVLESNIVGAIGHEDRCSPWGAVAKAAALHDQIMRLYVALRAEVEVRASASVRRHLRQLDHLIRGNLEWSIRVPRYSNDAAFIRQPVVESSAIPTDESLTPPRIPSIAWWWDQLGADAG